MHLSEQTTDMVPAEKKSETEGANWSRSFNTSILSTSIDSKCLDNELEALLSTPEFVEILHAAQNLSRKLELSPETATERLIHVFRSIDSCWQKILAKKGAQSLLGL